MIRQILAALILVAAFTNAIAHSEAQTPSAVRGRLVAVQGNSLDVTTRQGKVIVINLTATTGVTDVTYAKITDIKMGSFIGSAAIPQGDGTLKALEVHVFAPDLNGTGEGSRAWVRDGKKGTMTNGTVGDLVLADGRILTVRYHGGEKRIVVPAGVPIVYVERGTMADLAVGAHVIAFGPKGPDRAITALRVLVGKNGLVPPM
jgi:hypothetical protein